MQHFFMISGRKIFIESLKRPVLHLATYLFGFPLFWLSNIAAPTNLAGPGLDLLFLLLWIVFILVSFTIPFFVKQIPIIKRIAIILIHIAGISALILLLDHPTAVGGRFKL